MTPAIIVNAVLAAIFAADLFRRLSLARGVPASEVPRRLRRRIANARRAVLRRARGGTPHTVSFTSDAILVDNRSLDDRFAGSHARMDAIEAQIMPDMVGVALDGLALLFVVADIVLSV